MSKQMVEIDIREGRTHVNRRSGQQLKEPDECVTNVHEVYAVSLLMKYKNEF